MKTAMPFSRNYETMHQQIHLWITDFLRARNKAITSQVVSSGLDSLRSDILLFVNNEDFSPSNVVLFNELLFFQHMLKAALNQCPINRRNTFVTQLLVGFNTYHLTKFETTRKLMFLKECLQSAYAKHSTLLVCFFTDKALLFFQAVAQVSPEDALSLRLIELVFSRELLIRKDPTLPFASTIMSLLSENLRQEYSSYLLSLLKEESEFRIFFSWLERIGLVLSQERMFCSNPYSIKYISTLEPSQFFTSEVFVTCTQLLAGYWNKGLFVSYGRKDSAHRELFLRLYESLDLQDKSRFLFELDKVSSEFFTKDNIQVVWKKQFNTTFGVGVMSYFGEEMPYLYKDDLEKITTMIREFEPLFKGLLDENKKQLAELFSIVEGTLSSRINEMLVLKHVLLPFLI